MLIFYLEKKTTTTTRSTRSKARWK